MRNANQQKSIFVTGAASGIGRETALLFAERGWLVGLFDVNEKELRVVAETIGESSCRYQALDVTDPINYEQAIDISASTQAEPWMCFLTAQESHPTGHSR